MATGIGPIRRAPHYPPARRTHTSRQLQGELFDNLANEEAKHKEELEKLYYETVHSGGV